jgi:glucose-1-phosphate thymidylyltransferase
MRGAAPTVCGRMKIAKAVILAGNEDHERCWPTVAAGPRHLFPVANRPILFHQLERLRRGGLLEATILVDPDSREPIRRAIGDGGRWNLAIRYDECPPDARLADALTTCKSFIRDEPVLVQQADALLRDRLHPHIDAFSDDRLDAMALRLVRGHAEPSRELPPGYLLSPRALALLIERPDAAENPINEIRASGGRVRVQPVEGCLPCHGDLDALLDCNRRLLEELEACTAGAELDGCEVQGPVVVHPTARVRRSTLRGPAIIGPGAILTDAYVGPYTSIGANVAIEGAEIEHSIVLPRAELAFVGTRIESSVIGEGARVARTFRKPSSLRMSIGDGAEVLLS